METMQRAESHTEPSFNEDDSLDEADSSPSDDSVSPSCHTSLNEKNVKFGR